MACGAHRNPSSRHLYKSLEEASGQVKPETQRLLSKNYVHRWLPWEAIRQRWPCALATILACIVASSVVFATRALTGSLMSPRGASFQRSRPCVGLSRTASPPACSFGRALSPLGSHGREPVLEKNQVWPVYRSAKHHDHRPPTPRFQCNVDRNSSAQNRRTRGPCGKTPTQKKYS